VILFFELVHERWIGVAFPNQQVQGRSLLAAGTKQNGEHKK
jgi:hypothetical protein